MFDHYEKQAKDSFGDKAKFQVIFNVNKYEN